METITENHNWTECRDNGWWEGQSNAYIFNTTPISKAQETSQKRSRKIQEPEGQEVCPETVSPRNGCQHKP